MATNRFPIVSFAGGELSPKVDARSDVDKFRSGCRILENMIPLIYGPSERRPGTKYIETCNGVSRVIPFIYSSMIAYIVLLEDQQMWFYYNGGRVNDSWGRRLKVDTPYLAADLFELQYKQSNDVMWITHNTYAQRKLSRTSANAFALTEITFTNGPFMKRNDLRTANGVTLTPSVTTGSGTLTASSATFDSGHVGALFSIIQPRVNTTVDGTMINPATGVIGSAILVEGAFTFTTHGTWTGTVRLERSIDSGSTWEKYREWTSENADAQVQYTGNEEESNVQYRINVTAMSANTAPYASTTSKIRATLTVNSSTQEGICRVTGYTSSTLVSMTVLKNFASTNADIRWSEGCWSTYRGFPKCVTFFENRCVYAATTYQPQTVWFSAVDDFEDFSECTKDDSAFSLTMSSDTRNAIQWLAGADSILVGTTGSEWRIWSDEGALTPTSFNFKPQTERGSKDMQALVCGDAVLFVDFVGRKVRELTFDGADKYKYVSPDLTALAEHITKTGITSMAFQRNPDPLLWCTLSNGTLISMTYEREQNVIGWARHPIGRGSATELTAYSTPEAYPTLQVADGTFATQQEDLGLTHTTAISDVYGLQQMQLNLGGNYYLTQDIDASGTATWDAGKGFKPIGKGHSTHKEFYGTFDGCGYTISNLYINRFYADGVRGAGLFGALKQGARIANVTLENVTVISDTNSGSVVGQAEIAISNDDIIVQNCHATGSVTDTAGNLGTGGFVGGCWGGTTKSIYFYDCTTSCDVSMAAGFACQVGGFAGWMGNDTICQNCRATGDVTVTGDVESNSTTAGGFVACDTNDTNYCIDCAATGNVLNGQDTGGFVAYPTGSSTGPSFIRCSARGNVDNSIIGYKSGGGFSGWGGGIFTDCYSWGNVSVSMEGSIAGGFAPDVSGTYLNCYSTGIVDGETASGFIYDAPDSMTACFWDIESSGEGSGVGYGSQPSGLEGHSTAWMKTKSNYENVGYDFDTVWSCPDPVKWTGLETQSVAVIPSTNEDEVWLVVARVINGSTVRYLEQMQPRDWGDDQEDCWFVDSGLAYDGAADTTFSGLDHLEGEEVAILADGAIVPRQTVTNGSITLTNAASRVIVGLPHRYKLKPMRFDINTGASTTQTALKNIPEVVASFYKSGGVKYGKDIDNLFDIDFRTTEAYGSPPALFTGDRTLTPEGGFDADDTLIITGDDALPCTIRALVPRITVTGR